MRFLVTGASGLIGSALCDSLLAHGEEVVGLSRDPRRARDGNPTVTWLAWNPAEERPPDAAFREVDVVINLVGEEINQRLTPAAKERIHGSRVRATKNLVDGMLAASPTPPVLVSQCAVGYYGDRGEAMIDEETPPGAEWLSQLCVDWQNAALEAQKGGVRVSVFRTGLLLDADGGLLKQLSLPFKLGVGGPLAGGSQYMPWIHRDDEIGLLTWAAQNPQVSGVLNASAPNPVTNREFSKALGRALRRPSFIPAPKFAVSALRGGELADAISASLRVIPRRALDLGYSFRFTDVDTALRDLYSR